MRESGSIEQDSDKAFLKLKPDRALLDRMLEAIDRQKRSRAWRKDNGQAQQQGGVR